MENVQKINFQFCDLFDFEKFLKIFKFCLLDKLRNLKNPFCCWDVVRWSFFGLLDGILLLYSLRYIWLSQLHFNSSIARHRFSCALICWRIFDIFLNFTLRILQRFIFREKKEKIFCNFSFFSFFFCFYCRECDVEKTVV